MRGHSEAQKHKNCGKNPLVIRHFRDFWWLFHHWDLPEPPGGKYSIPKCSAWNFIKFETLSNQVWGRSEAQKLGFTEKSSIWPRLLVGYIAANGWLVTASHMWHQKPPPWDFPWGKITAYLSEHFGLENFTSVFQK